MNQLDYSFERMKSTLWVSGLVFLCCAIFFLACQKDARPVRLENTLDNFQVEPGMRIELMASEPLVVDPVAIAFDEDRHLYVVEDRGYPDPAEGGLPTKLGRVALLKDTNGDGAYDKRTEFATGLTYPNGVLPWRGGVFITCSPDVFYFKDTDGDGIADIRKVVLTGFFATQTAQIRMSYPTLGLDGWVYVTGGLNGGEVTSPDHPDRPAVSYTQADGRFNPETLEFQVTGGKSQFGLAFDSYGRRFGTSNRHPVMNIVIEPWHLKRNAHLLFNKSVQNVSKVEAEAVVYPTSRSVTTADFIPKLIGRSHAGTFTAASGLLVYNGSGLTPAHQGNVFICESAQNLVQRQIVQPDGVSFRSALPYEGREFVSSSDEWFRPVSLQHGPEGALYIVDMHRKVIDHPAYVPEEARSGLDWESGKSEGRIYRVVREGFHNKSDNRPKISSGSSNAQLVSALSSAEEWDRSTAHRLLLERKDIASAPLLKKAAIESSRPEGRARALWILRSLESLDVATHKKAFTDKVSGVREQAVLLTEGLSVQHPELVQSLLLSADDEAIRVRFNSALVLGSLDGPGVVQALAKVAARDGADEWVRAAVLSGIETRMPAFLSALREQANPDSEAFASVMQDLGRLYGTAGSVADCRTLFHEVLSSPGNDEWKIATILGLVEGISGRVKEFGTTPKGLLYAIQGKDPSRADRIALDNLIAKLSGIAGNQAERTRLRVLATSLLGYTNYDQARATFQKLLAPITPPELLGVVVASLTRLNDSRGAVLLTEKQVWSSYTPSIKAAVIGSLVSKPAFANVLFTAIEMGTIKAVEISSGDRVRLMGDKDPKISDRAKSLFEALEGGDRMKVYHEYRQILNENPDVTLGKLAYQKACSACHTYLGQGGDVGPDLSGVKSQPAEALLLHIVVPNYEVLPSYETVMIETRDGRTFSGRIMSETENSLTIRTAFGTDESILRRDISTLTNSGLSLMPDGLEQSMSKQDMVNLIAYLKSGTL